MMMTNRDRIRAQLAALRAYWRGAATRADLEALAPVLRCVDDRLPARVRAWLLALPW